MAKLSTRVSECQLAGDETPLKIQKVAAILTKLSSFLPLDVIAVSVRFIDTNLVQNICSNTWSRRESDIFLKAWKDKVYNLTEQLKLYTKGNNTEWGEGAN